VGADGHNLELRDEAPALSPRPASAQADVGAEQIELENARRRFILALRTMTVRKESQARSAETLAKWRAELDRDIAVVRRQRRANARRKFLMNATRLALLVSWLFGRRYFQDFQGFIGVFFFFFTWGAAEVAANPRRKETALALARARDPKAIGVLAKAARDGDPATQEAAIQGLLSILPTVRASDREHVDSDAMSALLALLPWKEGMSVGTNAADVALKLAILRALEQIGDGRAIPAVKRLQSPPRVAGLVLGFLDRRFHIGARDRIEQVCRAARDCLPFLEERAAAERLRDRLLRPAMAPTRGPDLLLRPAGGSPTTPDELLLRPVEGGEASA
jgi:hypothetical protein